MLAVTSLILLACCAALAVLPARWLMIAVPADWPLAIVDASGTVWSGTATVAIGTPARRRTVAEPLSWRLSLANGLKLIVSHSWLNGPLSLTPTWKGIGITAQTLQVPVAALATLDARIAAVSPGGELSFTWPATFLGQSGRPPGSKLLDIRWRNAVSALTPIRPLGDYALALTQNARSGADLVLSTQQGPLMLNGNGVLSPDERFRFTGTAQTDPAASADIHTALQDLLAALGPHRNNQTTLRFP